MLQFNILLNINLTYINGLMQRMVGLSFKFNLYNLITFYLIRDLLLSRIIYW